MTWRNRQARIPSRERAAWLREFEAAVVARRPDLAGRIEWPSALYYHGHGIEPLAAAAAYLAAREVKPQ